MSYLVFMQVLSSSRVGDVGFCKRAIEHVKVNKCLKINLKRDLRLQSREVGTNKSAQPEKTSTRKRKVELRKTVYKC